MRAMFLCFIILFCCLFVFFGIHYAKEIGREIKKIIRRLFH